MPSRTITPAAQKQLKNKSRSTSVLNLTVDGKGSFLVNALARSCQVPMGLLGFGYEQGNYVNNIYRTKSQDNLLDTPRNEEPRKTSITGTPQQQDFAKLTNTRSNETKDGRAEEPRKTPITNTPRQQDFAKLSNMVDNTQFIDTLHKQSTESVGCAHGKCLGSIMFPPQKRAAGIVRDKEEVITQATDFLSQFYDSIKQKNTADHMTRLKVVKDSIEKRSVYDLTGDELIFGAKTAWRNAARCIGRIQWNKLKVFDCRKISSAREMFEAICRHLEYGTNKGFIRSAITVFPPRTDGKHDFRVWNSQLIKYAGYKQSDGTIIGDPSGVEFTQICQKFGWKGPGGRFDILPLILSANGQEPELFELPKHVTLEVKIQHPTYKWFADLGLQWFALPAVSGMLFDVGGLEFTGCPFNGWYMGTEIGARDLCDPQRYNILQSVGEKMGLDTKSTSSLWKDKALVEVNIAVLHSFQKVNVTITDHHTASESFVTHMANEQRLRGGCPADWVWIVPPMSGSLLPVFHQEMYNYRLKPSYEYQPDPWRTPAYRHLTTDNDGQRNRKRITFRVAARGAFAAVLLMKGNLAKRVKCTILYATETGKSEQFSKTLCGIFNRVFDAKIVCMANYNTNSLRDEKLLLVVTSTFGEGEPPENGETFAKALTSLEEAQSGKPMDISASSSDDDTNDSGNLPAAPQNNDPSFTDIRFSVFALGSRAYPEFCAFGHTVDKTISALGSQRIHPIAEGDALSGQDEAFTKWSQETFKAACKEFDVKLTANDNAGAASYLPWTPGMYCLKTANNEKEPPLFYGLSKLHNRTVTPCKLLQRENLQAPSSSRQTVLVEIESGLPYTSGDHMGIYPANETELVLKVLAHLDGAPPSDKVVKVQAQNGASVFDFPPCTLRTAFKHYLDINTPPTQMMLKMLATQATNPEEAKQLERLGSNETLYSDWKHELFPNVAEVLELFPSLKVSPTLLITQLPLLQQRFYSISSSPQAFPGEIHATVAVVNWKTKGGKGKLRNGVCSSWLNKCQIGTTIPCIVHKAPNFHLPKDPTIPVIMVGPGTGIAPFRSFWQQRAMDKEDAFFHPEKSPKNWGELTLYFGCRQSDVDQLYKDEIVKAKADAVISKYYTAFSRDKKEPKRYTQDLLLKNAADVFKAITRGGHIYVCGSVPMARDMKAALVKIVQKSGPMSADGAKTYVTKLKEAGRLHEDIFGSAMGS